METRLTENNNGSEITCKKGDDVVVSLKWNPSSGYVWQASATTIGPLVEVEHGPDATEKPGAPAEVSFRFRVDQEGKVVLYYGRPWAEREGPKKWYEVNVSITSSAA